MKQNTIAGLSLVALLVACGGGGGGSAVAPSPAAVAPAPNPAPIVGQTPGVVVSIPVPTYAAGSKEKAIFDLVNAERSRCGFGLVKQAVELDATAKGHGNWMVVNQIISHFQTTSKPNGFTGVSSEDRARASGYTGANSFFGLTSEEITGASPLSNSGEYQATQLFNSPYHLAGLFRPYTDIGIGQAVAGTGTQAVELYVLNTGFKAEQELQTIQTYPCASTTVLQRQSLFDEMPNPLGRSLKNQPIGHPIYVRAPRGKAMVVSAITLNQTGVSSGIKLLLLDKADAAGLLLEGELVAMPDLPLAANSSFAVSINGTLDGMPFSRNFEFKTGAN